MSYQRDKGEYRKIVLKAAKEMGIPNDEAIFVWDLQWKIIREKINAIPDIINLTQEEFEQYISVFPLAGIGYIRCSNERYRRISSHVKKRFEALHECGIKGKHNKKFVNEYEKICNKKNHPAT